MWTILNKTAILSQFSYFFVDDLGWFVDKLTLTWLLSIYEDLNTQKHTQKTYKKIQSTRI